MRKQKGSASILMLVSFALFCVVYKNTVDHTYYDRVETELIRNERGILEIVPIGGKK